MVRDITGESAGTLIDEKVIYETKLLLNDSRFSIAQIADSILETKAGSLSFEYNKAKSRPELTKRLSVFSARKN